MSVQRLGTQVAAHASPVGFFDDTTLPPAGFYDVALAAAEMAPWHYRLHDSICLYSDRARQLYGLEAPTLVHDEDGVRRFMHPEDIPAMWRAVRAACDPLGEGRYNIEYRVKRHEGGWRWLSVWGLVQFEGVGPERRAVSITGASRDITERRRAEMFLEAQKRSLEMIVSGAPLAEILNDLSLVVERLSDHQAVASILFLDSEGRLRPGSGPSLPADYLAAIDGLVARADLGTCSVAAVTNTVVITPDIAEDPKWAPIKHLPLGLGLVAAWSQPINARDGRVLGTFGTYFRERRAPTPSERQAVEILARTAALAIEHTRASEALRDGDRRKDEFIATLSHELRNPLAPLRTALHLLRARGGDAAQEPLISTMERQVSQLVRLVDDLLEVSRISRGAVELHFEPTDVVSIVKMAIETTEPVIYAARHQLTLELPQEQVVVRGDRLRLAQVVANLLNNAAKYTEPGGRIVVRVRTEDAQVIVSVHDNGAGIDPAAIPELFELFVRGDRSALQHREGLGIGLALARRLSEMHGGTLDGSSNGPGTGSEFTLRLPRLTADSTDDNEPAVVAQKEWPSLTSRVLVVDDNADAAEMLAMLLGTLGCEVHVAHDATAAMTAGARLEPDVVLLDIGLPDASGHDVCRQMRQEAWGRSALIVAITGWGQSADIARSLGAGFDTHLVKPVDPKQLTSLLQRHETRTPKP